MKDENKSWVLFLKYLEMLCKPYSETWSLHLTHSNPVSILMFQMKASINYNCLKTAKSLIQRFHVHILLQLPMPKSWRTFSSFATNRFLENNFVGVRLYRSNFPTKVLHHVLVFGYIHLWHMFISFFSPFW